MNTEIRISIESWPWFCSHTALAGTSCQGTIWTPMTFRSRGRRSNYWVIPTPLTLYGDNPPILAKIGRSICKTAISLEKNIAASWHWIAFFLFLLLPFVFLCHHFWLHRRILALDDNAHPPSSSPLSFKERFYQQLQRPLRFYEQILPIYI